MMTSESNTEITLTTFPCNLGEFSDPADPSPPRTFEKGEPHRSFMARMGIRRVRVYVGLDYQLYLRATPNDVIAMGLRARPDHHEQQVTICSAKDAPKWIMSHCLWCPETIELLVLFSWRNSELAAYLYKRLTEEGYWSYTMIEDMEIKAYKEWLWREKNRQPSRRSRKARKPRKVSKKGKKLAEIAIASEAVPFRKRKKFVRQEARDAKEVDRLLEEITQAVDPDVAVVLEAIEKQQRPEQPF